MPSETRSPKSVAIVQSNYIPWKGYFDLIRSVDEFVLYDDQQYTRRNWRNRNRIKTAQGAIWLTIPVNVKGRYHQRIDETTVTGPGWAEQHWRTIEHAYGGAPCFHEVRGALERLYEGAADEEFLSAINRRFLDGICEVLGIRTPITWSRDYEAHGTKTERLVSLCRSVRATSYLSGPTARDYIDGSLFEEAGIELQFMDYRGYREYEQLYPPFEHAVSIVDLLAHTGSAAPGYLERTVSVGGCDAA